MSFFGFFKKIGHVLQSIIEYAGGNGLTDELIQEALKWVKVAASKELDNSQRREFVVQILMSKFHIPESIARLAVELAVQALKKELNKVN